MSRTLAVMIVFVAASPAIAVDKVDFSRDILPILSDNCFRCHGPDKANRKAKLRLDEEAAAKKAVIVPRKSGDSEIMRRLLSTDPADVMPPPKTDRKVTKEQIGLVRRWIDEGAVWGAHWAFAKVTSPAVPKDGKFAGRVRNPIDDFVFSRLEKEGLAPSPPASPEAILRRVKLDLTGLPPTLAEIDAFLADKSPNAYETMVNRFLGSPAFGERMAWTGLMPLATPIPMAIREMATARCGRGATGS